MSIEDLAKRLDITPGYLGLIERGERGTTASRLIALSRIFRISLDYLMTGREVAPSGASSDTLTFIRDSLTKCEQQYLIELAKELATSQYTDRELEMVFNGFSALLEIYQEIKINGAKL